MLKKTKIFIILLIILIIFIAGYFYYNYQEQKFEIIFFNVGQGDSALINLPGDNEILIDGGPDATVLYKLGKYLPVYNRDIELMILTHPHADHITGLNFVLDRYKVEQVMHTGVQYDSSEYEEFIKALENLKIKLLNLENIQLDKNNLLEIIYPQEDISQKEFDDVNDASIVFRLVTNSGDKILFTGDISANVEQQILKQISSQNLDANILKIAHQGSITSSGENFLNAVNPKWAVVSVGENKFGHPSLRVLHRLERIGAQVL
ncbi:MBL fold metallo-hydrolase, partial [Patescibacteria group bacterium]|nr:MBL fold metallo-hydrolase [Patescibacteria group bacterium]